MLAANECRLPTFRKRSLISITSGSFQLNDTRIPAETDLSSFKELTEGLQVFKPGMAIQRFFDI